jgi:galactosyl transferase GMA12/MNN10 family
MKFQANMIKEEHKREARRKIVRIEADEHAIMVQTLLPQRLTDKPAQLNPRSRRFCRNLWTACCWVATFAVTAAFVGHRVVAYQQSNLELVKAPMNDITRECPLPAYPTLRLEQQQHASVDGTTIAAQKKPSICMTTLTDDAAADWWQRLIRWRNFGGLLQATWPNKMRYCEKHGYRLFDSSLTALDTSRPPSWSKIRAVQRLLETDECDWVFWLDADTVIMNSDKMVESFLPAEDSGIDLILTHQKGTSWNAGAWLIRKSDWSKQFLDTWWNMKSFVRQKGQAASGDNAALKAFLLSMDPNEYAQHIVTPPRCQFNSVAKFYTPEVAATLTPEFLEANSKLYLNEEIYQKGDLIAHVAGTYAVAWALFIELGIGAHNFFCFFLV